MPFCARIVTNMTSRSRLSLSSHRASQFNLTFYGDHNNNNRPLLYLEFDVAAKTVLSGNFSADLKKVQFRQRPDVLNDLALVDEGSVDEMIKLSFPNKNQMRLVSYNGYRNPVGPYNFCVRVLCQKYIPLTTLSTIPVDVSF